MNINNIRLNEASHLPIPPRLSDKYGYAPSHDNRSGYTKIICSHPYHPNGILYMPIESYQDHFISVTGSLWANGYTFLIQPMD